MEGGEWRGEREREEASQPTGSPHLQEQCPRCSYILTWKMSWWLL